MNEKQAKRMRREVRRYLTEAGATREAIRAQWALMVKPRPWFVPTRLWRGLCWLVLKRPPGLPGQHALVDAARPRVLSSPRASDDCGAGGARSTGGL